MSAEPSLPLDARAVLPIRPRPDTAQRGPAPTKFGSISTEVAMTSANLGMSSSKSCGYYQGRSNVRRCLLGANVYLRRAPGTRDRQTQDERGAVLLGHERAPPPLPSSIAMGGAASEQTMVGSADRDAEMPLSKFKESAPPSNQVSLGVISGAHSDLCGTIGSDAPVGAGFDRPDGEGASVAPTSSHPQLWCDCD